jgi:hypothetical protein
LEIVASEVILTVDPYGSYVAKALLYPGALVSDITERIFPTEGQAVPDTFLPDWDTLLDRYGYNKLDTTDAELNSRMELNAGSNLLVFGSILSMLHDNKMSLMGVVLTAFFFAKQHAWLPREDEELSPEKSYIFLLFIPFVIVGLFPALGYIFDQKEKIHRKALTRQQEQTEEQKEEAKRAVRSQGKKDLKVIKRR